MKRASTGGRVMGDTLLYGFIFFGIIFYSITVTHHLLICIASVYLLGLLFDVFTDSLWHYRKANIFFLNTDISPLSPLSWVSTTLIAVSLCSLAANINDSNIFTYLIWPMVFFSLVGNIYSGLFYKFGLFEYNKKFFEIHLFKFIRLNIEKRTPWGVPYEMIMANTFLYGPIFINIYYLLVKYWVPLGAKQIYPQPAQYNYLIVLILLFSFVVSILKMVKISNLKTPKIKEFPKKKVHIVIPIIFLTGMIGLTTITVLTNQKTIPRTELVQTWPDDSKIYYNHPPPKKTDPRFLAWTFDNNNSGIIPNNKYIYLIHTILIMFLCLFVFRQGFKHINWVVYLKSFFFLYLFYWTFAWYLGLHGAWVYNNPTNIGVYYFSECIENLLWYYPLGFFNAFIVNNWLTKYKRSLLQKWAVFIGIPVGTFIYEFVCVEYIKMWNFLPEMVKLRVFGYFSIEDWGFYTLFAWTSIAVIRYNERSLAIMENNGEN